MDALVGNAGDSRQVREATRRKKLQDKQAEADWQTLLATPAFRRQVWPILEQCGVYQANEEANEHARGRKEGKRQIGLYLIVQMQTADPHAYVGLLLEHAEQTKKARDIPDPEPTDGESDDQEAGAAAGAES